MWSHDNHILIQLSYQFCQVTLYVIYISKFIIIVTRDAFLIYMTPLLGEITYLFIIKNQPNYNYILNRCNYLAHLTQRVKWGIAITWHLSSSVNLFILIFFSDTSIGPIGTKVGRNVHLTKFKGFFVDQKQPKKEEAQRCQKVYAHIYIYIYI